MSGIAFCRVQARPGAATGATSWTRAPRNMCRLIMPLLSAYGLEASSAPGFVCSCRNQTALCAACNAYMPVLLLKATGTRIGRWKCTGITQNREKTVQAVCRHRMAPAGCVFSRREKFGKLPGFRNRRSVTQVKFSPPLSLWLSWL